MAEVDPNLELQQLAARAVEYSQLAAQAVEYSQQRQQLPHQHQSPSSEENGSFIYIGLVEGEGDDQRFICPFPTCNRQYKRKDLLKRHLTTLATSPDEHHQDQATWDNIRETSIMTIYTRPR